MLDAVLTCVWVLLDLIMGVVERHQLLAFVLVQAQRIGLGLGQGFEWRCIGRKIRVPQHLLACWQRHRFEMIHRTLPFDGRQHLGTGGDEGNVQRHGSEMRPHLARLALFVGLNALEHFVAHLRSTHREHDRPQPRHYKSGQVEHADSRVEKALQTFEPSLAVFIFGGHGHGTCITQNLADMRLATALPQVTGNDPVLHRQPR